MFCNHRVLILGAALAVATAGIGVAQTQPGHHAMEMPTRHGMPAGPGSPAMPVATLPGQDAFGAVQEIVRILEADPKTDWSKVALEALRQHLIDMNEVTLRADATATEIDGGAAIRITGTGRALEAVKRLVPHHAAAINGLHGWSTRATPAPDGVVLTVTASDPNEVRHIRGLGFIGLLASGDHHQRHHLAMARGEISHNH
jgi:hypothetical protein